jgi:hypothetical protein
VGSGAAAEVMALYDAGKATSLAHANHVDKLFIGENIHQHLAADFQTVAVRRGCFAFRRLRFSRSGFRAVEHRNFTHELYRRQIVLAKVSLHGLAYVLAFDELHQADLRGFIAFFVVALDLRDHAWPGLQDGDRMNVTLVVKHLRHADLLA